MSFDAIVEIVSALVVGIFVGGSAISAMRRQPAQHSHVHNGPQDHEGVPMVPAKGAPNHFVPLARASAVEANTRAVESLTLRIAQHEQSVSSALRGINARLLAHGINGEHDPPHPFETTGTYTHER